MPASASELSVAGFFHPAGSSVAIPATLARSGEDIAATSEEGEKLAAARPGAVKLSPRVGSIPRRIVFGDGAVFVSGDNDGIDRLVPRRAAAAIAGLERFHPRLLLFAAVALLLLAAVYRFALPVLTDIAVALTPPQAETLVGQQTFAVLDKTVLKPTGIPAERQEAIGKEFAELSTHASGPLQFRLVFRGGGPIGANAFALPDGTIVVTDELIKLADNDEQILAVLAHEIGHVEKRHSLQRVYRVAGMSAVIMLVGGDIGHLAQDLLVQGSVLLSLSFSREQEAEADARGVALLRADGRDPKTLADMLTRLEKACETCGAANWLSTHPAVKERVKAIEGIAGAQ